MKLKYQSFRHLINQVKDEFQRTAKKVAPSHWQGVKVEGRPDMETMEVLNHSSTVDLPYESLEYYQEQIRPDLPWADAHFEERVCGYPLNPGTQWKNWRMNASGSLDPDGRFNHNYMERFWPKYARMVPPSTVAHEHELPTSGAHRGILYEYGDLRDLINLLNREPLTRQAFLPMFFPEDTGAVHRGRAPCSLGWQFIVRDDQLHCTYYLRSCDMVNHWRNDLYFAVRMVLWILRELRKDDEYWRGIRPGTLTTHITSFHVFMAQFCRLDEVI